MKHLLLVITAASLFGCGKFNDIISTGVDGYALRCIEGTTYILLSSDAGLAITPAIDTNGKPKGCAK